MSVRIREYISSDRDKICQLLSEFTEYKRDTEFWIWINRLIGTDESIVSVATDGDEIIGHYAIVPHNLMLNEISIKSGLGIHAFIHPEYRGKVLMYKISELAYEIAKKRGISIILRLIFKIAANPKAITFFFIPFSVWRGAPILVDKNLKGTAKDKIKRILIASL